MQSYFYTGHSQAVVYNGQLLDSLLELKFVLSIEETHAWIREGLEIYYNINTIPAGIDAPLKRYTPDILIRNWNTGQASLIEVKPDRFDDNYLINKRTRIAEKFIVEFGYDWNFQVIRSNDIKLSPAQETKYERIVTNIKQRYPMWFGGYNQNSAAWSIDQYESFVRNGLLPAFVP